MEDIRAAPEGPAPPPAVHEPQSAVKILVVDDLPEKQLAYRAALEEPGQEVVAAMSGQEALKAVLHDDFAVILLDVNMPAMDGYETAALIRSRKRSAHTPIIFMTAHVEEVFAEKGYSEGAVDFLAPVNVDVLAAKIRVFVRLFRLTRQLKEGAARQLAQAKSEQARLVAVLENAADFVGRADVHGRIEYVNRAGRRMIGYVEPADGKLVGDTWCCEQELPEFGLAIARRDGVWFGETAFRHHSGRSLPVSLVILAHKNDYGDIQSFSVIAHDITERKRAEEAVHRLAAERAALLESESAARCEAERLGRLKDEFLATVSHELRTPLNAILGWATLLQRPGIGPQEIAEGLGVIVRNARSQAQLISDLLDMNRVAAGKLDLDGEPVDLSQLVGEVLETLGPAANASEITLEFTPPGSGPTVFADPIRIRQVFWNVVSNAIKFTPAGGRIEIGLGRDDSEAIITIRDTGEGIEPNFLPHLFERFRQADSASTRRHGGLGLGLAISKRLVEMHGGRIRAWSDGVGRGALFTITLPLAAISDGNGAGATAGQVGRLGQGSLRGVKILVVDDEADTVGLTRRLLEDCQAVVQTAHSAAEALESIRRSRPDLLISDISMPVDDGYSLIKRVRRLEGSTGMIPALALTAFARPEDRRRSLEAGFQAHINKPIDPWQLISTVAKLTQRSNAAQGTA